MGEDLESFWMHPCKPSPVGITHGPGLGRSSESASRMGEWMNKEMRDSNHFPSSYRLWDLGQLCSGSKQVFPTSSAHETDYVSTQTHSARKLQVSSLPKAPRGTKQLDQPRSFPPWLYIKTQLDICYCCP